MTITTPNVGQSVTCNGYPGTITAVCEGQLTGMVEVRLARGVVCVSYHSSMSRGSMWTARQPDHAPTT